MNKRAEKYCVRSKSGIYYIGWIGLFLFSALLLACLWLLFIDPEGAGEDALFFKSFGIPLTVFFLLLCGKVLYDELRPRVVVEGDALLYYPRWKKPIRYQLAEISGRRTWRIGDDTMQAIGPLFGIVGSLMTKDLHTPRFEITYLIDGKPAMKIHTGMKNASRLDETVQTRLKAIKAE